MDSTYRRSTFTTFEKRTEYQFAVIDGKQRVTTVWEFLDGTFPLSDDFRYQGSYEAEDRSIPEKGMTFSSLPAAWQTKFLGITLDIVEVKAPDQDEIEDLFARLNNGEKLNAAESRNAMGGRAVELIHTLAAHDFFSDSVPFSNKRLAHFEVAAKFLLMTSKMESLNHNVPDLKKKYLDGWVQTNRTMSESTADQLLKRTNKHLGHLRRVFGSKSPHLEKQSYPQMMFLFVERISDRYGHPEIDVLTRDFLDEFLKRRRENLSLDEDERDPVLTEFGRLSQQGTNDPSSMEKRYEYMTRFFLEWNADVVLKDKKRFFTSEERYIIWLNGDKRCANCAIPLETWSDVSADHETAWIKGGQTSLENAQALCSECNSRKRDR